MRDMKTREKLRILADAAKYDASCASGGSFRENQKGGVGTTEGMGICHSFTPDGRCVSLLKILLTNYCIYDCRFCVNRISSEVERARFTPEEVVSLTLEFYKRNFIEGLFLSSGIIQSPDYTMEQLVRVGELLRDLHEFGGYIHLKAVPGASPELLRRAGRVADRLSANIELPTEDEMVRLAPAKSFETIEKTMSTIETGLEEVRHEPKAPSFIPAGQTTQMIVGASPTPDRVILEKADQLYQKHRLRRVYYSAFSPIPDSDPGLPLVKIPLVREHRLYQADWLRRFYGFNVGELTTPESPNLDLELDPKVGWALRYRHLFPVDINTAPRELLLRIPGLGVRNVDRIIKARQHRTLSFADLARIKVPLKRAKYFILTNESNPHLRFLDSQDLRSILAPPPPSQLELFGPVPNDPGEIVQSVLTGEL